MSELVPNYFIEAEYVSMYPDIAAAVTQGDWRTGAEHYVSHGRAEGRQTYRFDEAWYLRAYPVARMEIEAGLAPSPRQHFEEYGCNRGYLPNATSERPDNPTAVPSRFGGLWVDQPNARDLIAGRLELGTLTPELARQLRQFVDEGYVIIEQAVPDAVVAPALEFLERSFVGDVPELLFECPSVVKERSNFLPEFRTAPAKALDVHWMSEAVRELIFAERIGRFLGALFDSRPIASQTLGFYRGSQQESHQDSAFVPYTQQRHFAASWIALEDVAAGAGELFMYDGSHRLQDALYDKRHKSVSEANRAGVPKETVDRRIANHVGGLPERARRQRMRERTFLAKRGDVLIWHADLVHGGKPITLDHTRKSVVTHYCGKFAAPLFAEKMATPLHEHAGRGFYTTSHYAGRPPSTGAVETPREVEMAGTARETQTVY